MDGDRSGGRWGSADFSTILATRATAIPPVLSGNSNGVRCVDVRGVARVRGGGVTANDVL